MKVTISPNNDWIHFEFSKIGISLGYGAYSRKLIEINYLSLLKKLRIESKFFGIIIMKYERNSMGENYE